jgi:DNA-binding IclR family transcriptional regulator
MEQNEGPVVRRQASGTQAIHRALTVLRCIARSRNEGIGLSALSKQAGLIKSTTHRLTTALIAEGLVEQEPASRRYYLGSACHALGLIAADRYGLHKTAARHVARLAHETGDAAFFSVRQDVHAICLLRIEGDYPLKSHALLAGDRHPLGVGAGSLAMLAALDDAQVEHCIQENLEYISANYPRYNTEVLHGLVQRTRDRGYSVNPGLVLSGSLGIGMAVRGENGEIVGALSIATVEGRLGPEREAELARALEREVGKLQKSLRMQALSG